MPGYAQTHIQLYRQLLQNGYTVEDIDQTQAAYELAGRLSSGLYRPSGKPNLDHLVGTASILCALRQPIEVVVAGLLHSIYTHGDFGTLRKGISNSKRSFIQNAVGKQAEEYVARYSELEWTPTSIADYLNRLSSLSTDDRSVILLRLADRLEDTLDGGNLYCASAEGRLQNIRLNGHVQVKLAHELGFPSLAQELEEAFASLLAATIPAGLQNAKGRTRVYLLTPLSYRKRFPTAVAQSAVRLVNRISHVLKRFA